MIVKTIKTTKGEIEVIKTLKKIILLILISLSLLSCSSVSKMKGSTKKAEETKEQICKALYDKTGIKFYFIYGFHYDSSIYATTRYRGMLYSEELEAMSWPRAVEIGLKTLEITESDIDGIISGYKSILNVIEIDKLAQDKAREIFGEKTILANDGTTTPHMYNVIVNKKGQKLSYEEKTGYNSTKVSIFVDDLEKLDINETKKKLFDLGVYIYEELNYRTSLGLVVRDKSYFQNLKATYRNIYKPFREREDIRKILEKLEKDIVISDKEEEKLIKAFDWNLMDYENTNWKSFWFDFSKNEKNFPMVLKNVKYTTEFKDRIPYGKEWYSGKNSESLWTKIKI